MPSVDLVLDITPKLPSDVGEAERISSPERNTRPMQLVLPPSNNNRFLISTVHKCCRMVSTSHRQRYS